MSDGSLGKFIYALEMLEHERECHKCTAPSDESMDNLVETAIDLLWPKAGRLLRGDGWLLTRENDMSSLYTKDQVFEWEIKAGEMARTVAGRVDVPAWANLDRIQLGAMLYDALVALREQMSGDDGD